MSNGKMASSYNDRDPVETDLTCGGFLVVENDMDQAGAIDGILLKVQGRLVRSERYKYCIYSRGLQRESLVDLDTDLCETKSPPMIWSFKPFCLQHRALLETFAKEQRDSVAAAMLVNDVRPLPFPPPLGKFASP